MRARSCLCSHPGHTSGSQNVHFGGCCARDNLPEGTTPLPWGSKRTCPYPWCSLALWDRHPPTALPSWQPNTNPKGAQSEAGKGSEQLKMGIKELRREISCSCIYTPAQPSKAMRMQHRVSEYVMNISLDFGT